MYEVTIIRVPRLRRMSLRVVPQGGLVVRASKRISDREIDQFVIKNSGWIEKQKKHLSGFTPLTTLQIESLRLEAKKFLPERTKILAQEL